jgi:hypothetical protein
MNSSEGISESSDESSIPGASTGTEGNVGSITEDAMVLNRRNKKIERHNCLYIPFLYLCSSRESLDMEMFGTQEKACTT